MRKRTYLLKDSDTYHVLFTELKEEARALVSDILSPFEHSSFKSGNPSKTVSKEAPLPNWSYPTLESIPFTVSPPIIPGSKKDDILLPVHGSDLLF